MARKLHVWGMGMAARLDNFHEARVLLRALAPPASALRVTALRKACGEHEVLKDVDLDLMRGEVVVVIGESGAGKSTLLRCLHALDALDALDEAALQPRVGLIFQGLNLQPQLSVGGNVMLAPALVDKAGAADDARELLARVGLADKFHALPGQLSLGEQQRVVIARALAMEPTVLLCDEITTASDVALTGEVATVVEALAGEGMALLMVTHDLRLARRVADRVVFLHGGRVHESGPPAALFGAPRTAELRRFLASRRDRPWPGLL